MLDAKFKSKIVSASQKFHSINYHLASKMHPVKKNASQILAKLYVSVPKSLFVIDSQVNHKLMM